MAHGRYAKKCLSRGQKFDILWASERDILLPFCSVALASYSSQEAGKSSNAPPPSCCSIDHKACCTSSRSRLFRLLQLTLLQLLLGNHRRPPQNDEALKIVDERNILAYRILPPMMIDR